jgi:hypothetical protein
MFYLAENIMAMTQEMTRPKEGMIKIKGLALRKNMKKVIQDESEIKSGLRKILIVEKDDSAITDLVGWIDKSAIADLVGCVRR